MDSLETAKLKKLQTELDRLCADARKIREHIEETARRQPLYPEGVIPLRPLAPAGCRPHLSAER